MASETEQTASSPDETVALPPKLDTSAASILHAELLGHVGHDVELDGSAVEQVGGRCFDLLLTAQANWRAAGNTLHISSPTEAMQRDLTTLGAAPDIFEKGDAQ